MKTRNPYTWLDLSDLARIYDLVLADPDVEDTMQEVAARWQDIPRKDVTAKQRQEVKTLLFARIYSSRKDWPKILGLGDGEYAVLPKGDAK